MNDHGLERLSEYIDGDLTAEDAAALEAHLAECAECATTLGELREVVTLAHGLEPSPPASDLWPGIRGRLEPRSGPTAAGTGPGALRAAEGDGMGGEAPAAPGEGPGPFWALRGHSRPGYGRLTMTVPQVAAAGIALMLFTASAMWMALGGRDRPGGTALATPEDVPTPGAITVSYQAAIQDLEGEFQRRRATLDPATIRVVEQNLATIDAAIGEARRALESDPASGYLNGYLAETMQRKVDLLRQATRIQQTET